MRVWSDGADPAGRSFRVGFEIRNNAEPDLIFRPGEAVLRFSDFEVDDVASSCFQSFGADENIEGGFDLDAAHAIC